MSQNQTQPRSAWWGTVLLMGLSLVRPAGFGHAQSFISTRDRAKIVVKPAEFTSELVRENYRVLVNQELVAERVFSGRPEECLGLVPGVEREPWQAELCGGRAHFQRLQTDPRCAQGEPLRVRMTANQLAKLEDGSAKFSFGSIEFIDGLMAQGGLWRPALHLVDCKNCWVRNAERVRVNNEAGRVLRAIFARGHSVGSAQVESVCAEVRQSVGLFGRSLEMVIFESLPICPVGFELHLGFCDATGGPLPLPRPDVI